MIVHIHDDYATGHILFETPLAKPDGVYWQKTKSYRPAGADVYVGPRSSSLSHPASETLQKIQGKGVTCTAIMEFARQWNMSPVVTGKIIYFLHLTNLRLCRILFLYQHNNIRSTMDLLQGKSFHKAFGSGLGRRTRLAG